MARSAGKKVVRPGTRDAPVGLRLGDLQWQVQARRGGEAAPGAIVKRDLGRYYTLLADTKRTLSFTLSEAEALVVALRGFEAAAVRYIWAEIDKQYRLHAEHAEERSHYLPTGFDPMPFLDTLRRLSVIQNMAILDAVECYWLLVGQKYPDDYPLAVRDSDLLVEVGLVSPARRALDLEDRQLTAAQGKPGKVIDTVDALRASLSERRRRSDDPRPLSGDQPMQSRG
jgi:hypothetical protein